MNYNEPISVFGGKNSTDIQGLVDFARIVSMIFSDTFCGSFSCSTITTGVVDTVDMISDRHLLVQSVARCVAVSI